MFNLLLLSTLRQKFMAKTAKGFTLIELLIAASLTLMVVGVTGWALMTVMKTSKIAKANSELQYDFNRAVEFMAEEIRSADKIDYDLNLAANAPGFTKQAWMTPVLSLEVSGVPSNIVYYIVDAEARPTKLPWAGRYILYRWGPDFNDNGSYSTNSPIHAPLVDMLAEKWEAKDISPVDKRQCRQTGGSQGWVRLPNVSDNDLKGFFVCVPTKGSLRGQQAELHVYGKILAEGNKNAFLNKSLTYGVTTDVMMRAGDINKIVTLPNGDGTQCLALTLPTVAPGSQRSAPIILNNCVKEIETVVINKETNCEARFNVYDPSGNSKLPPAIKDLGQKLVEPKDNMTQTNYTTSPVSSGDEVIFGMKDTTGNQDSVCKGGSISTKMTYPTQGNPGSIMVADGTSVSDITGKPLSDTNTKALVDLLAAKGLANTTSGIITLKSNQFLVMMEGNYNVQYKNAAGTILETNNYNFNDLILQVTLKP